KVWAAHGEGFLGRGLTIGVVDTGVMRDHPLLSGRVLDNFVYVSPDDGDLSVDDAVGHGTAVAQIAAGASFAFWPGGVAPAASIVSARLIPDAVDGAGGPVYGIDRITADLAAVNRDMMAAGASVLNNAWGGPQGHGDAITAGLVDAYRPFVTHHNGLV